VANVALDVHCHLVPIVPKKLARLQGIEWRESPACLTIDGYDLRIESLFYPEKLLSWMKNKRVQEAWISIPPPLYRQKLDENSAEEWSIYLNDGLLEIANDNSALLRALLHLPMEHPRLAQHLLARYSGNDHAGYAIAAGGEPRIIFSDPAHLPLWEELNAGGAFVFIHPGFSVDKRLAAYYLENLIGNPIETGIAATHLVMANIPNRFPNIRFCLAHGGGIFTGLIGRLERGYDTERPGIELGAERPVQAARRLRVDCLVHNKTALRTLQEVYGSNNVLFGSDWPFPMGLPEGPPSDWEAGKLGQNKNNL
jgi:aminocarboxymuconate-semialdehyde decarboxylase